MVNTRWYLSSKTFKPNTEYREEFNDLGTMKI